MFSLTIIREPFKIQGRFREIQAALGLSWNSMIGFLTPCILSHESVLEVNVNFNAIVRTAMTDQHLGKTAPKKS